MIETWPAGETSADGIRWPDLVARRAACGSTASRDLARESVCATSDGFCEVPELPIVDEAGVARGRGRGALVRARRVELHAESMKR